MGGFSALIDVIQSEYGWSDETVLGLSLARLNQIRDAVFIRTQQEMYGRHNEIEWIAKHLATTIVNSTPTDDVKWKEKTVKSILDWDMDARQTSGDTGVDGNMTEADIEKMWAEGAQNAMSENMNKPSFGSVKLG